MSLSISQPAKNGMAVTNDATAETGKTWDEATETWDEAEYTWDRPRTLFTEDTKTALTITNAAKN